MHNSLNEKKYIVYKHTTPNGKNYIGITCTTPKQRWRNGKGYKENSYFDKAIKKYGWENIQHEILFEELTHDQACQKEIELIEKLKSNNRLYGYNLTAGGEGRLNVKFSDETLKKLSESHKGIKPSDETRLKMSESMKRAYKENPRPKEFYEKIAEKRRGKNFTEEQKRRVSLAHVGIHFKSRPRTEEEKRHLSEINKGKNSPVAKSIICLDTLKVYDTIVEASKQTNINKDSINGVCLGKHFTAGGMYWSYYDKSKEKDYYLALKTEKELERKKSIETRSKKTQPKESKRVICLDTGIEYESIQQASRILNLNPSSISACCRGVLKKTNGLRWSFLT